jgi:hypothetical protein
LFLAGINPIFNIFGELKNLAWVIQPGKCVRGLMDYLDGQVMKAWYR